MNKNDSVPNEEEVETFFIRPQKKFFVVLLKKRPTQKSTLFRKELLLFKICDSRGSGCSTVVEHKPRDHEVVGLNPAEFWAFFLFL